MAMKEKKLLKADVDIKFSGEEDIWSGDSLRSGGWSLKKRSPQWRPPTDVLETDSEFMVVVEIAGMRGLDISATYDKGLLTIHGLRVDTGGLKAYHQMEIAYGEFQTEIRLTGRVETEKIEATYSDGFLRVMLPKLGSKQIPIEE
jgi:HSP20 family protein